jgi:hypothetical protein
MRSEARAAMGNIFRRGLRGEKAVNETFVRNAQILLIVYGLEVALLLLWAMSAAEQSDPAAIFAIATSLSREFLETVGDEEVQALSDVYAGIDGFMRTAMHIAAIFESWACRNVRFADLTQVWPYLLYDNFGPVCRSVLRSDQLEKFCENDCPLVARRLRLPTFGNNACI